MDVRVMRRREKSSLEASSRIKIYFAFRKNFSHRRSLSSPSLKKLSWILNLTETSILAALDRLSGRKKDGSNQIKWKRPRRQLILSQQIFQHHLKWIV